MGYVAAPGSIVGERYQLDRFLGSGGMGVVWSAQHVALRRPVAVKFVSSPDDPRASQRFLVEARAAAKVRHRNVVDILDFGVTDNAQPYMVMEFLEGMTLSDRLGASDPLSLAALLEVFDQALDGLRAVHEAGLVHRDLKPDNIFLVRESDELVVKLMDFGLTLQSAEEDPLITGKITNPDELVGTPAYMSPEQARRVADIDSRSDIYSAGTVLYEAMSGILPFKDRSVVDMIVSLVQGERPKPLIELRPEIGERLSTVIERAMAAEREDRYDSVTELRKALREAARTTTKLNLLTARPVSQARHSSHVRGKGYESVVSGPTRTLDDPREVTGDIVLGGPEILIMGSGATDAASRTGEHEAMHSRWRGLVPLASALLFLAVGVLVGVAIATRETEKTEPTATPAAVDNRGGAADLVVKIRLIGVPQDASLAIDGRARTVAEAVRIPRDGRRHVIEVSAPGQQIWRREHIAEADGVYHVHLTPTAEPLPEQEQEPAEEQRRRLEKGPRGNVRNRGSATATKVESVTPQREKARPEEPGESPVENRPIKLFTTPDF